MMQDSHHTEMNENDVYILNSASADFSLIISKLCHAKNEMERTKKKTKSNIKLKYRSTVLRNLTILLKIVRKRRIMKYK
jgi:hypothetical protein